MAVCVHCGETVDERSAVCPQCGAPVAETEESRSVQGREPSVRKRWLVWALVITVFAVGVWAFYRDAFREFHPVIAKQPEVGASSSTGRANSVLITARVEGPFIIVPLSAVKEHRIVRFYDPEGRQQVPMIAYVTENGRLVTAMSLSENCRSDDFYLEGEMIHCAHCPSYWNASSLEAYACCQKYYPDPIASTVLGDEVRIEASVVRAWQPRS